MSSTTFWNGMARRYSEKPISDQATYEKKLEKTRSYFHPDMELLEIGCGTGSTALLHAPYVKHIVATDISKEMIAIAQSKQQQQGTDNIRFETMAVEDMRVSENSKDMVLALSILHLLEDREAAIQKAYRWLKPGGYFVTSTVCGGSLKLLPRILLRVISMLGIFGLVIRIFSNDELVESLKAEGFEIEYRWLPGEGKALFVIAKKPD